MTGGKEQGKAAGILSPVSGCSFWTEPPHDRAGVREAGGREDVRVPALTGHSAFPFTICTETWF